MHKTSNNEILATNLPDNEKAASLSCCEKFVFAVSENGKLFMAHINENNNPIRFDIVPELVYYKFLSVSGSHSHCFAVCNDGRVFGYGLINCCNCGIEKGILDSNKFVEVTTLKPHKIISASAGNAHCLFVTNDGKLLACGYNGGGQLFTLRQIYGESINFPFETCINKGARFCMAGCNNSIVFIDCDVPKNSPNSGKSNIPFEADQSVIIDNLQREIFHLREENLQLRNRIERNNIQ